MIGIRSKASIDLAQMPVTELFRTTASQWNAVEAERLVEILVRDLAEPNASSSSASHQPAADPSFRVPSSAQSSRQSDPLQHGRCGQKHIGSPQMGEHCQDDRLTAIGGPRGVRAHLQAGPPVGQPEVPQAEMLLQLDRVLPAGLIPECVVGKCGWGYSELLSHKDDHRLWRVLVRSQALARIPEEA
jgi:hypothetical protein